MAEKEKRIRKMEWELIMYNGKVIDRENRMVLTVSDYTPKIPVRLDSPIKVDHNYKCRYAQVRFVLFTAKPRHLIYLK